MTREKRVLFFWVFILALFFSWACSDGSESEKNGGENTNSGRDTSDTQNSTSGTDSSSESGDTSVIDTNDTGSETEEEIDTDLDIEVSSVLTPFDGNHQDVVGPSNWATNYGKSPEIIAISRGSELFVLAQDYDSDTNYNAVLMQIKNKSHGFVVTMALTQLPMLDRIMGLDVDESGYIYYATGVNEDNRVDSSFPPLNTYRNDIVRVVKLNPKGEVEYNKDLDTARHASDNRAEMIINPMVAATSRLAVGGGEIALVHGNNTDPDWDINGTRHQKALSTRLDALTGEITRVSTVWCSHSFDQRLLYDGNEIIEHHLGDAYPRYIVFSRFELDNRGRENFSSHSMLHIKGALGANNTHTRLGNMALTDDLEFGYIALFSTESTAVVGDAISGPRNLGMVRINHSNNTIDSSLPDTLSVTSSGNEQVNRLRWLTDYSADSNLHAERPKLVRIGSDAYVVLWEQWRYNPNGGRNRDVFEGIYAMVIDSSGVTIRSAALITDEHHLQRGDDAFALEDKAGWITGNRDEKKLYLHLVDSELNYEMVVFD